MEKKKVAIETPVAIAGLTIIPVTRTSIYSWQNVSGISFLGLKKPLYVLILDRQLTVKAFTITGEEIPQEKIASDYPELKDELKRVTAASDVSRQPLPEEPRPTTE